MTASRTATSSTGALALTLASALACQGWPSDGDAPPAKTAKDGRARADADTKNADAANDALPDAKELLAAAVAAQGGKEKFAAIKSYHSEATISSKKLGLEGSAKIWWKEGDFVGETFLPGVGMTKMGGYKGTIWSQDPISGLRSVSGKEAEQTVWSTLICLQCDWERFFTEARTVDVLPDADGDRKLAHVKLTSAKGNDVTLAIDLETKLPAELHTSQISPLGEMPVRVLYEDYREVEGMKLSFRQVVDAKVTTLASEITNFEINVPVDEQRFAMPGSKDAVDLSDKSSIPSPPPSEGDAKATAKTTAKTPAAPTEPAPG